MGEMIINGVRLELTCGACPEQYDAFIGDKLVGYLRLRYGYFSVRVPDASGDVVYSADVGDGLTGIFRNDRERERHLNQATKAIFEAIKEGA